MQLTIDKFPKSQTNPPILTSRFRSFVAAKKSRSIDVDMLSVTSEEGGFDLDILRINHSFWHKPAPTTLNRQL
jgi:hypothetical protein